MTDFNERFDGVSVVSVLRVELTRGRGTKEDICRKVTQYWDQDGTLICELDSECDCRVHAPDPVSIQSQKDTSEQSRTNADAIEQQLKYDSPHKGRGYQVFGRDNAGVSNPLAPTTDSSGKKAR